MTTSSPGGECCASLQKAQAFNGRMRAGLMYPPKRKGLDPSNAPTTPYQVTQKKHNTTNHRTNDQHALGLYMHPTSIGPYVYVYLGKVVSFGPLFTSAHSRGSRTRGALRSQPGGAPQAGPTPYQQDDRNIQRAHWPCLNASSPESGRSAPKIALGKVTPRSRVQATAHRSVSAARSCLP